MKKILQGFLLMLFVASATAQNGFTFYPLPSGYTMMQTRDKRAFTLDHSNNKWVGFGQIGLGKFNGTTWTMYDQNNSSLPGDQVNAIVFDGANKAWIGTQAGAASFDGTSWNIYNTSNSGIAGDTVLSVAVSGNQHVFGTTHGLSLYNGTSWTNYTFSPSGLPSDSVYAVEIDVNGRIWIGTIKGLSSLSGTTFTNQCGGITAPISTLYIDPIGNKWTSNTSANDYFFNGTTSTAVSALAAPLDNVTTPSISNYCKGPYGGTLFWNRAFYEIAWPENHVYYPPSGTIGSGSGVFVCAEQSSGKVWMLNKFVSSQTDQLACFDINQYNEFGLGTNYDNIKTLDINDVAATMQDKGDIDWNGMSAGYEVPKGSGVRAVFAASLWIGGLDNANTLHQSAATYRQNGQDYWPGPLDTLTGATDTATCQKYDKIWKIDRFKIAEFIYNFNQGNVQNGTYIPEQDIIDWPAKGAGSLSRNLAPFVDVNHNGIYDPLTGGDYPVIKGDQELYWIYNDNLTSHTESGGKPMKVEVHASTYAYTCPSITDSQRVLNYTTFYHYEIYNRSGKDYHSVILGHWEDSDLGNFADDMVGCYPNGNYGYVFNGAACDGTGSSGTYGCKPPMLSTLILDGPLAVPGDGIDNNNNGVIDEPGEKNMMTGFLYYNNDFNPVNGNPVSIDPYKYYDYLSGRWQDSTHMTKGGNGIGGAIPTNFMWPDFPSDTSGWSEVTVHDTPGDRRFLMSCGPFNLLADSVVNFDLAYVWSRDTSLVNASKPFFDNNLNDVRRIRDWYTQNNAPSCLLLNVGIEEQQTKDNYLTVYPNPANDNLHIDLGSEIVNGRVEIVDVDGRLEQTSFIHSAHNVISVSTLAAGFYFVRVIDGEKYAVRKFVKQD